MNETPVVTAFLRNEGEVLLLRRSDEVGSYRGRWGAVAGHAEGDPDAAVREEIREETGIDPDTRTTHRRRGDPFAVVDADLETRWVVHPYLFDCDTRTVEPNEETTEFEWVAPPAILRRETVPDLWTSYDRVRPGVATIRSDSDHGAAFLSVCALEVLRDEAALAATGRVEGGWATLVETARRLVDARPAMPVLSNRVDRAMAEAAADRTPAAIEEAASDGIERAVAADGAAASAAAEVISAERVATLSRSGTVRQTLGRLDPGAVLVAESRPGGEGVAVASELAEALGAEVTLTTDAAFPALCEEWDADALVVGADAVCPDGSVRNKVGTRAAATLASSAGHDVYVVAAAAKITADRALPAEPRPRDALTADDAVAVENPTFETTPATAIDAVITEHGILTDARLDDVVTQVRARRHWRT
jgi:translation initiation factor 2B subunit (eIF-2B alpha/beta/delta family)/8-oxo-dGTP pyrophosphatase MutT (NUDIX family)